MEEEDVDWDAFAILSADPEIDVATAFAASIRDEPPQQQPSSGATALVIAAIIGIALLLLLMAL